MGIPSKLEGYLSLLDKTLGPISISERAEIVTEIKSHVLEAQQRDPSLSLESILNSLGEPEQVANKYLLERGLKPSKPPTRPFFKWLVVGFLGSLFLVLVFLGILIWKFSPLIQVNDDQDRVALFGGLIDVNGKTGSVHVGGIHISDGGGGKIINGSKAIDATKTTQVLIPFTNGKFNLSNSSTHNFVWECKVSSDDTNTNIVTEKDHVLSVDLGKARASKCDFQLPTNMTVKMTGDNVSADVEKPKYDLDMKANNAKVEIEPDTTVTYTYDIKVLNGKVDQFDSAASSKGAFKISVSAVNGVISRD